MENKNYEKIMYEYLPKKYASIRPQQIESINFIINSIMSGKKNVILELPPGVGKSLIVYLSSKILRRKLLRTTVTTSSLGLQKQYSEEFMVDDLSSKVNYGCPFNEKGRTIHYDSPACKALCSRGSCSKYDCDYWNARRIWMDSNFRMTNSAFFTECCSTICSNEDLGNKTDITFTDEAHNLANTIIEHSTIDLENRMETLRDAVPMDAVDLLLGTEFDKSLGYVQKRITEVLLDNDTFTIPRDETFRTVLFKNVQALREKRGLIDMYSENKANMKNALSPFNIIHGSILELKNYYDQKIDEFEIMMNGYGEFFVIDKEPFSFKPLRAKYSSYWMYLRKASVCNIFISGTIIDEEFFAEELGLDDYSYLSVDSPFPLDNRPIYDLGVINYTNYNKDEALVIIQDTIDKIIAEFPDKRGLIHTHSFKNAEYLKENSKYSDRMVITNSKEVHQHLKGDDLILLSPSLYEGVDLPGNLLRFQILMKAPYAYLGDKFVKIRMELVDGAYEMDTIQKIIQAYGRGMRYSEDFCDTFIVDKKISTLITRKNIPKWVKNAIN